MRFEKNYYKVKISIILIVLLAVLIGAILMTVYILSGYRNRGDDVFATREFESIEEDISTMKEEALRTINHAVQLIDESQREEIAEYVLQAERTIRNAKVPRTVELTLETTMEYLESVTGITVSERGTENSLTDEDGFVVMRQLSSEDGRLYTPIDNQIEWDRISDEQRLIYWEHSIPVLMDEENMIDKICTEASYMEESRSWTLPYQLYLWCEYQKIEATRGEYITYGEYYRLGKESFFIRLNDQKNTYVEVTCYSYGQSWSFDFPKVSAEEIESYNVEPGEEGGT